MGVALIASAFSTVLWLSLHYEQHCVVGNGNEAVLANWIVDLSTAFARILADYDYYPIFFVGGLS